jgi:hypothetical protein
MPEPRKKAEKEEVPDLKSTSSDSDEENGVKRKKVTKVESDDEDSDLDSDDAPPTEKPPRRRPTKATPPKPIASPIKTPKKTANKRDMSVKRNRRRLHSLVYEAKMDVDMKDLFKQVQKGDFPRSPIKTLMMPSP